MFRKMLKTMVPLFAFGLFLTSAEGAGILSLDDIASVQRNPDGTYAVICRDLSEERVTDMDLKVNNVCPHSTQIDSLLILSVQKREDGNFDVVCRDLTRKVAARDEIMNGKVCTQPIQPPNSKYDLAEGLYLPESTDTFFCENYTLSNRHSSGGQIQSFSLTCPNGTTFRFTCAIDQCKEAEGRVIVMSPNVKNRFSYTSGAYSTYLKLR